MPCMRRCRARCVFSPKLGIIIQDFARQLFDQLLADQAILMAGGAVLTLRILGAIVSIMVVRNPSSSAISSRPLS